MSSSSYSSPRSKSSTPARRARNSQKNGGYSGPVVNLLRMGAIYAVLALVITVIVYFIARDHYAQVHAWARVPWYMANPVLLTIFLLIALLLAAAASGAAHAYGADQRLGMSAGGLFVLIGILLAVIAYLVYQTHNYVGAFYLALLALLAGVAHIGLVASVSPGYAAAVIPLALLLIVAVYLLWYAADESADVIAHSAVDFE